MDFHHSTSVIPRSPRARTGSQLLLFIFWGALLGWVAGCEGGPQGPTAVPARISGYVYQRPSAELGEPMLADVLITVEQVDGAQRTARTNAAGFYTVFVTRGVVSISAAKAGYQTNRSQFDLSSDTVLNFSLVPDAC
jgi:hypothetical protein